MVRQGSSAGLRRPKISVLGTEFAGEVEAVGSAVTSFAPGDLVFGVRDWKFGAHAEYVCIKESAPVALKPAGHVASRRRPRSATASSWP